MKRFNLIHRSTGLTVITAIGLTSMTGVSHAATFSGTYNFANEINAASVVTDQPADLGFSSLTAGDGLSTTYSNGQPDRAFSGKKWTSDPTIAADDYFQFALTPTAGRVLQLTELSFDAKRSNTGPANWLITAQIGSAAALTIGSGSNANANWNQFRLGNLNTQFNQIADTITFQLYGFGASSSAGTWRIDNVNLTGEITDVNSLPASGAATPKNDVPTPLIIPGIIGLGLKLRQRLKAGAVLNWL